MGIVNVEEGKNLPFDTIGKKSALEKRNDELNPVLVSLTAVMNDVHFGRHVSRNPEIQETKSCI